MTDDATEARWSAAVETMGRIYSALGGEMFLDGYRKDGTVHTSHPLGGCRMADSAADGVTDTHQISQPARRIVGKWVSDNYRRRPMIIPVVVEV